MTWFQVDEEIEKLAALDGLRRKDHVLELARLMVRAESSAHRTTLLNILQVRTSGDNRE